MIYESIFVHFNKREEKKMSKKYMQGHHDASLYDSERSFSFFFFLRKRRINALCHQEGFQCCLVPLGDVSRLFLQTRATGVVFSEWAVHFSAL